VAKSTETLKATKREVTGTTACRRLRAQGEIPAIIYGRKEEPVPIQVHKDELDRGLRLHARMFDLKVGRKKNTVLLKEVQYDAMGDEIIHADFVRVAMDEAVTLNVPIELKGAPKVEHSVLQQTLDHLEIECLPSDIPEAVIVPVGDLEISQNIQVSDIEAPEGVTVLTDPEVIVVTLTATAAEEATADEEAASVAEGAEEPEIIGKKPEDEAEGTDEKGN